jgi:hypothetical protein
MSGWDDAPDYGGPKRPWWGDALTIAAAVLFSAVIAWLYFASASAQTTTIVRSPKRR